MGIRELFYIFAGGDVMGEAFPKSIKKSSFLKTITLVDFKSQ